MSYQVLARKYRPAFFSEMVGQEHVLQALINALDQNRLHHAYLFTGTRGVGKTTIARILAKCLNCETGLTSTPCGECPSCREIAEGRSIDLIEVDAASRTGVDDTRELLDNVQYLPTNSRYKVYLIDEVHMFSKSSFNALLKTLEEPPEHVKFLLATTDPKKLPVTVLSRCLQLNLRNMTPEKIVTYLKSVLDAEGVKVEEPALWQMGKAADGSMRDALSLTDQAIAHGKGFVSDREVLNMLGGVDQREVYNFLDALIEKDGKKLLGHIREVAQYSPSYSGLLADLLSLLHRIAIVQEVPESIDNSLGDRDSVLALAERITPEDVHLCYQIGLIGQRDLPLAPDMQSGFEMILLRMLAFRPQSLSGKTELNPSTTPIQSAVPVAVTPSSGKEGASQASAKIPANAQELGNSGTSKGNAAESSPSGGTSGGASPRIAEMLATINGESRGDDPSKKPEVDPVAIEQKSTQADSGPIPKQPIEGVAPETAVRNIREVSTALQDEPVGTDPEVASAIAADDIPSGADPTGVANEEKLAIETLVDVANWTKLLSSIELSGVALNLASNCHYGKLDGDRCLLHLSEQHASLWNKNYEERIAKALSSYFDRDLKVEIQMGKLQDQTPAQFRDEERQQQLADALTAIKQDENVKTLLDDFEGTLITESVRPI
jgi:DNA polymerase-3 subunit gamma/tau